MTAGDQILLDDGNLELRVLGVSGNRVLCEVADGGPLKSHKGMNLPGVALSTPAKQTRPARCSVRKPAVACGGGPARRAKTSGSGSSRGGRSIGECFVIAAPSVGNDEAT